ncbi:hypothetical protein DUI87_25825 [Hirundo rustica rustica]|uniref:Uncharacterized protein n=1 Tax=Hirundo rustica rustica TaxID=333673 RepID=A0A3M0J9Z8_HIRRU|nr:hypothetical protein DUI87_25825 [Hirundo rustica rustica]
MRREMIWIHLEAIKGLPRGGVGSSTAHSANLHSSATMIGQLTAAVCAVYGIAYSGYYLTHLARHLTRVFRGDDPESTEATALSALAPSAPGEEAKEEPKEGNYCLIPAVVTAQLEYSKPGSIQHLVEQQDVEHSGDVSAAVTPTSAGAESGAHESLSPSADEPLFLNAAEHMHTEVVKEAVLVAQRPLEEPEDPCEQKQRGDEEMGAKARAAGAESPAYVPHSPRADGLVLLDTAQSMAASAEGTESPGHTVHSQTADAPLFLHHRDFLQTEVLKRAVLMVQEPLE